MARIALLSWLALFLLADIAHGKDELLADDEDNGKWILSPDGGEARISGRDARYPELVFDLKQLKHGPTKAQLETDAKYFYVMAGRKRIKMNVNALKHEVTIDVDGQLQLDGKTDDKWTEDWKKGLAKEGITTVSIRFARCDFAKVTWKQTFRKQRPKDDNGDPADPNDPPAFEPADPEDPAVEGAELRKKLEASLVQLRITRENAHARAGGLATIIHLDGLAVTNLHVVEGAKKVEAKLAGVEKWIEVTPVAWDAELDLALLQLSRVDPMARATMKPLAVADKMPAAEDVVWLAGHTGTRMTMVEAKAISTGRYGELEKSLQSRMRHSALSNWVVVSGQMPTSVAGGAALDAQGRMIGIPAWTWDAKAESSPILSADHFQRLLESRPIEAPTWAQLNAKIAGEQLPRTTFPQIELDADQAARDVQRATLMAENGHECDLCKGDGVLTKRVQKGYQRSGGVKVPIFQYEDYTCPRCEGSGLDPNDKVFKQLTTLADAIARANRKDTRMDGALGATRDLMRDMARNHFKALQIILNGEAKKMVGAGAKHVGEPIVLVGTLVRTVNVPGQTTPAMGLHLSIGNEDRSRRSIRSNSAQTKMLLTDPVMLDRGQGKLAIVTGILAGYVQIAVDQAPVAVVSRGLIVPIDEDKIIVRKTAEELNAEREKKRKKSAARPNANAATVNAATGIDSSDKIHTINEMITQSQRCGR